MIGPAASDAGDVFAAARRRMVDEQLIARGIRDARVLAAMAAVPRHAFVDAELAEHAYGDHPLPTRSGQTISQPWIVARMLELCALEPRHRVLEVGTGSGYQTALLARLCAHVVSVERLAELVEEARGHLAALGVSNVTLCHGDGTLGWQDSAPYARVLVVAAAPRVPGALREQLEVGGVLVIPVGGPGLQTLEAWTRRAGDRWEHRRHGECRFVPLVGQDGWPGGRDVG